MRVFIAAATLALASLSAAPAHAGWRLIDDNEAVSVAKGKIEVTPGEEWNRWTYRPVGRSEVWTLDGVSLNELYFVSRLQDGKTIFTDANRKERPLPTFSASMLLTDIPDFYESSSRLALNTSVFEITGIEASSLAGHNAVRFTFEYAVEGSPLRRKGLAVASIFDEELHLISFTAPELFYFDRDLPKVERIIASATLD